MNEIRLSKYGELSSVPSPASRMMGEFASDFRDGVDINLGVGYVNEHTIPSAGIQRAFEMVLQHPEKYRQALNYGGPEGSENLIRSIRRFMIDNRVGGITEQTLAGRRVIIGSNGATSLLESLAQVLPAGIVVTSDPTYYIYANMLERLGFEILPIREDHDGMRIDVLEHKLDELGDGADRVSFFYLVTINNPSCAILSNPRRRQLVQTVTLLSERLGRAVPLVLDRAYEDLVHDPAVGKLESGLLCDAAGLVYEVGTLSKVLAPALRIGYLIGRDGQFMDAMAQHTFDAGFSASLITQEISSWLLDYQIEDQLTSVRAGYRAKAQAVRAWVDQHLGDELEDVVGGRAGFYLYLTFRDVETCEGSAFFRYLARTTGNPAVDGHGEKNARVVYIPGQICVHSRGELAEAGRRQLRLSYAYETLENLHRAILYMKEAVKYATRLNQATVP